jgi:excisionase family DNA binding protein
MAFHFRINLIVPQGAPMSIRVNRICVDYDRVLEHSQLTFEHKADVELVDLVTTFSAPDYLRDVRDLKTPIFNRDGNATIVRDVGSHGVYYLYIRPSFALSKIVVDPDDVFVDVTRMKDQLVYCFYNGTRRQSISITATIVEDLEGVARELSTGLADSIWRQYFIRKILQKPDARPLDAAGDAFPPIMNAAQVAKYLGMEEKTIRNWTSEGKIPHKKVGSAVRYRKSDIDAAFTSEEIGKAKKQKSK